MKSIKFKLLISVGIIVLAFSVILLNRSYNLINSNIERLINQQVGLALSYDLAIREYVAEKVRPLMYRLVDEGDFIPETMSTSFVARNIFEKVSKDFPDYIIKFSARNPRNIANLAGPAEQKMIEHFNNNPRETMWAGEIPIGGKPYFAKFSAMRMEESCLRCHGDPADAPASLKIIYGVTGGFHLPLGKVVGLDTIAIPVDKISKLLMSETVNNFVMLGVALVALFVSMALVLRFVVTDRLSRLAEHFKRTTDQDENGKIEPVEARGEDEISTVARSFNSLAFKINDAYRQLESKVNERTRELTSINEQLKKEITERRRAEGELRESEEKLRSLYTSMNEGVCIHTMIDDDSGRAGDYKITHVNPAYEAITGISRRKAIGAKASALYGTGEAPFLDIFAEVAQTGRSKSFEAYWPPIGKHLHISAFSPEKGVFATVFTDITERKKDKEALQKAHDNLERRVRQRTAELSEANEQLKIEVEERKRAEEKIKSSLGEKEILLREVHHRVKNNFEIISSLLDMSSINSKSRETQSILGDARARIYSMALIHSQLYQSRRFDQVNMKEHVRELVDHLTLVYADIGKNIETVIEPSGLYLSVDQAIPCALVLNELAVNAYKHAFRVGDRGRVYIAVRRSADRMVQISVKDDGDGIAEGVDINNADGLGLRMVRHLVKGQLKGKIQVNSGSGTEFLIEFKKK